MTSECQAHGSDPPGVIRVAAAVLRDRSGRVLLTQRPAGKHLAGTWEYPGGKCEERESAPAALARELAEELGIRIGPVAPLLTLTHNYPDRTIRLMFYDVETFEGVPRGLEGQALRWVAPESLAEMDMPAADRPINKALDLPPYYAITPDPAVAGGVDAVVDWVRLSLEQGNRLLQLRAQNLDETSLARLARRVGRLAAGHGARWLLNGAPELADRLDADGVHLTSRVLRSLSARPLDADRLVVASCHDADELHLAGSLDADLVTISPVRATASHPGATVLGWDGLEYLCRRSPLPVFALGGVGPGDLERARKHGAFGVAGISAFGN